MKNNSDYKTAKIYAKALYEGAIAANSLNEVVRDVETLQKSEIYKIKEAGCFINPVIDFSLKCEIIDDVAKKLGLCPQTLNMLKILIENKKFGILEYVLNAFFEIYNQDHNISQFDVETVIELSTKQDAVLREKLAELFAKDVKINYVIKPEILGGLVIKSGTKLIDLSLKSKFDKVEQLMKGTD